MRWRFRAKVEQKLKTLHTEREREDKERQYAVVENLLMEDVGGAVEFFENVVSSIWRGQNVNDSLYDVNWEPNDAALKDI